MTIKRMFKFTLPALLFAAGVTAYAAGEGPILLKDKKTKVTWAEFAKVINDPTTIKGSVDPESQVAKDYKEAFDAYLGENGDGKTSGYKYLADKASKDVEDAQEAYNDAKQDVDQWTSQLASLQADRSTLQEERNTKQTQLSSLEKQLAAKQADLPSKLASLKKPLNDQLATQQRALSAKDAQIANKQAEINDLMEGGEKTAKWLSDIEVKAKAFSQAYQKVVEDGSVDNDVTIFYYLKLGSGKYGASVLYLSYETKLDDNYTEIGQSDLADLLYPKNNISSLNIYLGSNYTGSTTGFLTCSYSFFTLGSTAYSAINDLVKSGAYTEPDPDANKDKIATATATLTKLQGERDAIQEQIDSIEEQIADIDNIKSLADLVKLVPDAENNENYSDLVQLLKDIAGFQDQIDQINDYIDNEETGLNKLIADLTSQITGIQADLKPYTDKDKETGKTGLDLLYDAIDTAKKSQKTADENAATAKATLDDAQAKYKEAEEASKANGINNYKEVTIVEDFVADVAITTTTAFDGEIVSNIDDNNGKGHVITLGEGLTYLFRNFTGILSDVAVNGKFRQNGAGSYHRVAIWDPSATGTTLPGRYYDADGAQVQTADFGEFGFNVRGDFSVDFATKKLVPWAENALVYGLTVYDVDNQPALKYLKVSNGGLIDKDNNAYTIPVNNFAETKTDEAAIMAIPNVFYKYTDGYKAQNVVIKDRMPFYCPVEVTAANIDYDREFTAGMNVVCLPFALKYDYSDNITNLCEYDRETIEKFYFTRVEEGIAANTPALIVGDAKASAFKLNLSDVTIKPTPIGNNPKPQIVMADARDDKSAAFGTFKKAGVQEFRGNFEQYKIYGLAAADKDGVKLFQAAGEGSVFPAFRMVISSELGQRGTNAPRRIAILDEKGVEIIGGNTTGIESVEVNDASSLNVAGGQGEIVITSEADYGTVPVYAIDGKLVAKAEVVAGTTTVNVQKGIYIVLGKKVLVK